MSSYVSGDVDHVIILLLIILVLVNYVKSH